MNMSKHELLEKLWFKEILRGNNFRKFIVAKDEGGHNDIVRGWELKKRYHFYTNDHRYTIVAVDRSKDQGYLGCVVSTRKPRAGEDWTRGNDLPDGEFTPHTWIKIKNAIIKYELVELAPKQIRLGEDLVEGPL